MSGVLTKESRVAALVPHFRCEPYLAACLESLIAQTRPLDAIIVLDDGSEPPPLEIVARFPQVTLLHYHENVGPYRLVQQAIDDSDCDGFLFQDADDRSRHERLARLLVLAEEAGSELVGCQTVNVELDGSERAISSFPLDVNAALATGTGRHVFSHGSSLVSKRLHDYLGGFANGLRFGADSDFLWRAQYLTPVVNSDYVGYLRLLRPDSLTHAPDTGFGSPAREALKDTLRARRAANALLVKNGLEPELRPYSLAAPIELEHLAGPALPRPRPEIQRERLLFQPGLAAA